MNNIILSTYFTSKPDIQRGHNQQTDSFDYIENWYSSIVNLVMNGIIFHDGLTDKFINKYTCKNIKFEKVVLGDLSNNDERFFIYQKYLNNNKFDNVFMTDVSDVWFKEDPFKLINNKYKLCVGSQQTKNNESNWWKKCYEKIYGEIPKEFENKIMMNAGIIGGTYKDIMIFLDLYIGEMTRLKKSKADIIDKEKNISFNMMALNQIIYSAYEKNEIYTGKELHSPFKSYLKDGDYCIFHK